MSLQPHPLPISNDLLVAFLDKLIKDGKPKYEALVAAGKMKEKEASFNYSCLLQIKEKIIKKEEGVQTSMFENTPAPKSDNHA